MAFSWIRDRSLTLVLLALFAVSLGGQLATGWAEFNDSQRSHGVRATTFAGYLSTGHPWEALFENWESEFLQMALFILLTTFLVQRGSPESRRPGAIELVDADPRRFRHLPDVPWPVRRGGWVLKVYENSLGLALVALFLLSWVGHLIGGWKDFSHEQQLHGDSPTGLTAYLGSSRFWFESFQNWQSEFLSIAAMVWLAVYLRQRYSPESKPVHAPHDETGH